LAPHDAPHAVVPGLQNAYLKGAVPVRPAGQLHAFAVVVAVVLVAYQQLVRLYFQLGIAGGVVAVVGVYHHAVAFVGDFEAGVAQPLYLHLYSSITWRALIWGFSICSIKSRAWGSR